MNLVTGAADVPLTQQSVAAVEARIRPYVRLTPVITPCSIEATS